MAISGSGAWRMELSQEENPHGALICSVFSGLRLPLLHLLEHQIYIAVEYHSTDYVSLIPEDKSQFRFVDEPESFHSIHAQCR